MRTHIKLINTCLLPTANLQNPEYCQLINPIRVTRTRAAKQEERIFAALMRKDFDHKGTKAKELFICKKLFIVFLKYLSSAEKRSKALLLTADLQDPKDCPLPTASPSR